MMDGFDPDNNVDDRQILYEVTKKKLADVEFNDTGSSDQDLDYTRVRFSTVNNLSPKIAPSISDSHFKRL